MTSRLLNGSPEFVKNSVRRRRGAKAVGIRYERKIHAELLKRFQGATQAYIPGPWFEYTTDVAPARKNFAQPDGLVIDIERGLIVIIEVKRKHCAEAYFQLVDKYLPLVKLFFNNQSLWKFATLEVVYWFDGTVAFPTKPILRKEIMDVRPGELGVHILRP